ncbi:MAG: LptF/LptG family permease [Victivallales bacterium]|nr:LptF/LptG family permease [Victivallales bacterium]
MRIIHLYITRSFLVTFGMAMFLLSFGLVGAKMVKVFEYLSRGVPVSIVGTLLLYLLPVVLTLAIPWAMLVSVMLVFGRLSADSEITAMRACGISILQIISPLLLIAMLLSGICLFLQSDLGPRLLGQSRWLVKDVAENQPLALLEPGRPFDFNGTYIYIDDRVGENEIRDIQIYRMDKNREHIQQDITAGRGWVLVDKKRQVLTIKLENCTVISYGNDDAELSGQVARTFSKELSFSLNFGDELNSYEVMNKIKYMSFKELFAHFRIFRRQHLDTTSIEVELNQRIALALAPFAFILLGLPLAIRTSRRETSVGLFLSVILMGVYFLTIIISDSLTNHPHLYPQYLLWIPVVGYHIAGLILLFRLARH